MEALGHLLQGFAAALTPGYLLYAFAGCMLGTLIGVLPGLGPAAGTAILIPLTFSLDATGAIIIGTLLDELERTGKGTGLATLCIASGMGAATIIERV